MRENERMKLTSQETRESTCESSGTEEEGYTGLRDVSGIPKRDVKDDTTLFGMKKERSVSNS